MKGIAAGISLAATVLPLVEPAINIAQDQINKIAEERNQLVEVPELYSKGFPLTIEQATKLLDGLGFKFELIKLSISDAKSKYKDCFDLQVIETHPKAKQKVKPGSNILIKYITQEVIDESQKIFEEAVKQKIANKEKTKQTVTNAIDVAKKGVQKIPSVFTKRNKEDADE